MQVNTAGFTPWLPGKETAAWFQAPWGAGPLFPLGGPSFQWRPEVTVLQWAGPQVRSSITVCSNPAKVPSQVTLGRIQPLGCNLLYEVTKAGGWGRQRGRVGSDDNGQHSCQAFLKAGSHLTWHPAAGRGGTIIPTEQEQNQDC